VLFCNLAATVALAIIAASAARYDRRMSFGESLRTSSAEKSSAANPAEALSPSLLERARRIRVLLFDVDGVLTDGSITVMPDADGHAVEVKSFSAHDGMGISLARLAGIKLGFVTKRKSQAVEIRARDLKIEHVYQGQSHKIDALNAILKAENCSHEEVAYVGDDIIDLPVMRLVGLAIATANARPQVKAMAHWTTPLPGGQGAGRDAIDFLLNARGILDSIIAQYLDASNPEARKADIGIGNM
jgi:3-deoxy-D-manno-octulosonate 8-phosphate phosphatase (KDO 8-P phosphatase)